jgi:hypothetical protein
MVLSNLLTKNKGWDFAEFVEISMLWSKIKNLFFIIFYFLF